MESAAVRTTQTAGPGCVMAFGAVFALMAAASLVMVAFLIRTTGPPSDWITAECRVTRFEIEVDPDSRPPFLPTVEYTFQHHNETFTGTTATQGNQRWSDVQALERIRLRLLRDPRTRCFVNPEQPSESILLKGPGASVNSTFTLVVAGVSLAFLALGIGLIGFGRRLARAGSVGRNGKPRVGRWFSIVFFGVFALVGGVMTGPLLIQPLRLHVESAEWRTVPCEIIWSRIETRRHQGKTSHHAHVLYRYSFNGITFHGDRIAPAAAGSSSSRGQRKLLARYPEGSESVCLVNPEEPCESLLNRELGAGTWIAVLPLAFLAVGCGGVLGTIVRGRKRNRSTTSTADPDTGARLELDGGRVRRRAFTVCLLFTLVWNGILTPFLIGLAQRFQNGVRLSWDLLFFLPVLAFAVVGLGLIFFTLHSAAGLFSPKPRLALVPSRLQPGGTSRLDWRFPSASGIDELEIVLVGSQKRRRSGRDTSPAQPIEFARVAIARTRNPREIESGGATFQFPDAAVIPDESNERENEWKLLVHAEVRLLPDVRDEFKLPGGTAGKA